MKPARAPIVAGTSIGVDSISFPAVSSRDAAAWRHRHGMFSIVGATNVHWACCPDVSGFAAEAARAYYPGKAYVDWIGADGYNWAPELAHARWRSFEQAFPPFFRCGFSTDTPMLVGEHGTVEGAPGTKTARFTRANRALRTQFPAIRAVIYFESGHENFGQDSEWRVTTSRSSLAAFRAFAQAPYFDARRPAIEAAAPRGGVMEDNSP